MIDLSFTTLKLGYAFPRIYNENSCGSCLLLLFCYSPPMKEGVPLLKGPQGRMTCNKQQNRICYPLARWQALCMYSSQQLESGAQSPVLPVSSATPVQYILHRTFHHRPIASIANFTNYNRWPLYRRQLKLPLLPVLVLWPPLNCSIDIREKPSKNSLFCKRPEFRKNTRFEDWYGKEQKSCLYRRKFYNMKSDRQEQF